MAASGGLFRCMSSTFASESSMSANSPEGSTYFDSNASGSSKISDMPHFGTFDQKIKSKSSYDFQQRNILSFDEKLL
ncbi:hypothetical protein M7I_5925 [Glarea lozoyensis 74030]|uniref:Uncharacterized protein n=1 Tax=Glarea lozoyensis (strain ATCC 74030 / MF5533) TaxID=1104152 RepID=H0ET70_GLAL7|nr:hypothetical protein M7I_5925 [Glarea lozoyensis 74030]